MTNDGVLMAQVFQAMGILFGLLNGFKTVHYVIEDAWDADRALRHDFLCGVENIIAVDERPLYLLLHESTYCGEGCVSNWAAHRMLSKVENQAFFDAKIALEKGESQPIIFTGEIMFPWMLDELPVFRGNFDLQALSNELAKMAWPKLYEVETKKSAAKCGDVKIAAATYVEEMFANFDLARDMAKLIGSSTESVSP